MGLGSVAMKSGKAASRGSHPPAFGFNLPNRGPLARPELLRRLAQTADRLRYQVVTVSDHVVLPTRSSGAYPYGKEFPGGSRQPYLEPLALMGWLLSATRRVRVGVSVLVIPYRNPVVTAKQLATLDVLSGGRVVLGAGVGWWPEEFEALAAPPFAQRGPVTDEYVSLMKELWTRDEPRFTGQHYRLADVMALPRPVQVPHPPIWIGGHTERALRRTAHLGDAWHPIGLRGGVGLAPDELATKVVRLRELTRAAGRDPGAVGVAFRGPLDLWPRARRAAGAPPTAPAPLSGPPAKVIEDIRAYQRAGVDTLIFDFPVPDPRAMVDLMARFAREVRPKVARRPHAAERL
jgi:probable F420-dependent oxidoreductase